MNPSHIREDILAFLMAWNPDAEDWKDVQIEELVQQGQTIHKMPGEPDNYSTERRQAYMAWATNSLHILEKIFGDKGAHFQNFQQLYLDERHHHWSLLDIDLSLGIIKGALDDFKHEMLFDTRTAIEAELFDDFLEQADVLLAAGYKGPAAVIAGSVLEDALRKICQALSLTQPDKPVLDILNQDIARTGAYSKQWQKRITALADTRNHAAHGQWDKFTSAEVESMIRDTNDFMRKQFEPAKRFTP